MPVITLPDQAKSRLRDLEIARMSAEDAMRAAAHRLNRPGDADELRDGLISERDRQTRKHAVLHQLLSKVNQFLAQLPRDTVLEVASPVSVDLKPGEKPNDAVERLRTEIKMTRERVESTKRAPLTADEQTKIAERYVVSLMRQAKPSVAVVGDKLRVGWRGDMAAIEDTAALIAWIAPDALLRALEREIAAQPARADAVPAAERVRRVGELEGA